LEALQLLETDFLKIGWFDQSNSRFRRRLNSWAWRSRGFIRHKRIVFLHILYIPASHAQLTKLRDKSMADK
jgi:hypothetical protein